MNAPDRMFYAKLCGVPPFCKVVAYAPPGVSAFALGIATGIFRNRPGLGPFDLSVCADRRGTLPTDAPWSVRVDDGVELLDDAELVLILPGPDTEGAVSSRLRRALRAATDRGAVVAAHCLGVFTLAAAGVADGLEVTTHWQFADELARRYPTLAVRPDALFIDQGAVVTGAGAGASVDLYLHLVRREHGSALANAVARLLVVPPHRGGGQKQYVAAPIGDERDGDRIADVIGWARANLSQPLSVDVLAQRALMSRRSFVRHFQAATGTSPHTWVVEQRLKLAEELLETTDLPIEQIATRVGYRSAAVLRARFRDRRGVAPRDYRRTFSRA